MAKFKVVVTDYEYPTLQWEINELAKVNAELFPCQCKNEDAIIEQAAKADALLVQYAAITERVLSQLPKCRGIVRYGVGIDNIDLAAATRYGIPVANVPDYGLTDVADHTMALLLTVARKIVYLNQTVKAGQWNYKMAQPLYRLQGKKLGIVAFGHIARLVAERARPFGMQIQVFDPFLSADIASKYGVEPVDFDTLVTTSDYIVIHAPANQSTFHLFNREVFRRMKNNLILINTARGTIIDEEALVEALQAGYIAGAGLDVTEVEPLPANSSLLTLDNLIITPHAAWYTEEAQQSLQMKAAQDVVRILSGQLPLNLLNREVKSKFIDNNAPLG